MTFVYEPEAAALYCRLKKLHAITDTTNNSDSKGDKTLKEGRKILVFDMGGKINIYQRFRVIHF